MIDEEEKYLMDIEDKVTDIPDWFTYTFSYHFINCMYNLYYLKKEIMYKERI